MSGAGTQKQTEIFEGKDLSFPFADPVSCPRQLAQQVLQETEARRAVCDLHI